ncbi:MAG: hypothetical protein CTY12_06870 [Methylotenera sp.]|nr:MAG: hypothetical protein CTY14_06850 [Methylotenera sp.]PPD52209.1 MAG: hypothetical protein CTY12_06870 [Methylotenera sp.]
MSNTTTRSKLKTSNTSLSMRILKIAACPTCSAKATLTYHLGCTSNSEIYFRLTNNTGGGFFSAEWVSLSAIQEALAKSPQPITSFALIRLFLGKSTNTPAFLLATLVSEGLLKAQPDKLRGYEILDSAAFMAEVSKLIASDVNLKVAEISNKTAPSITKTASTIKLKKSPV